MFIGKSRRRDCESCKRLGVLWDRCIIGEDEDDNDEDDLNLVNPKFTKNNSVQSNGVNNKKVKKLQPTGEKGTTESKKIKMKYWKIDFYRDQDRNKMDILAKKLSKMRKKAKSSSNIRKIVSSQSKVNHKTTSSVNKISNRKNSKKVPVGGSNRRIIK